MKELQDFHVPEINQPRSQGLRGETVTQPLVEFVLSQPRSQGLRGETVTKTLVKFVLSFQNFGEKIACAVRQPYSTVIKPLLQYGCVALHMRFFSQNFGTIKRILPGSSSLSHREGPGTEVGFIVPKFWDKNRMRSATQPYCNTV